MAQRNTSPNTSACSTSTVIDMNDDDSLVEEVSSSVLRRTDLPFGLGRKGLEGGEWCRHKRPPDPRQSTLRLMDVDEELVTSAAHCGPLNSGREALLCGGARGVDHGTDWVSLAGQPDETHDVSLSRTHVNGQVSKEDNSPIMHHCSGSDVTLLPEILGQIDQPLEKRRLQVDIRL